MSLPPVSSQNNAALIEYLRSLSQQRNADLFTRTSKAERTADVAEAGNAKRVFQEENFKMSFGTTEAYSDILYGENSPERERQLLEEDLMARQSAKIYSAVVNAFASDKKLLDGMHDRVDELQKKYPDAHKGGITYVALQESIIDNRDAFPPEEFVMRVNYWDKNADPKDPSQVKTMLITIPSLKMVNAMKFAERNAEKERAFFQAIADQEKNAALDREVTAIDAMRKALKTLVDNQPVEDLFNQPKADEETLAKPYLESALSLSSLQNSHEILAAAGQG